MQKAVFIKWVDSFGCTPSWQALDGYKPECLTISSLGFIVYEDEKIISISGNYADETANTMQQANGIMTIPKCSIEEQREIII